MPKGIQLRKIDRRSTLKHLSKKKQTEVVHYLVGGDGHKAHKYSEAVVWAKERFKIDVTVDALTDFLKWYLMEAELDEMGEAAEELRKRGLKEGWLKTVEESRACAQAFFIELVLQKRDPHLWAIVERVNIARDKVALAKGIGQKDEGGEGPELTPNEREHRVKEILGIH